MTDFRTLDAARRSADPLPLDLIESYARGRLTRRDFVRRGTVLGLSLGTLSAVITACGGGSGNGTGGSAATGVGANTGGGTVKKGGTMRVACVSPAGPLDP